LNDKKILIYISIGIIVLLITFFGGFYTCFKIETDKYSIESFKYENSIKQSNDIIGKLNDGIAIERKRIIELERIKSESARRFELDYKKLEDRYRRETEIYRKLTTGNDEAGKIIFDIEQELSEIIEGTKSINMDSGNNGIDNGP
jgi:hypothetical protein